MQMTSVKLIDYKAFYVFVIVALIVGIPVKLVCTTVAVARNPSGVTLAADSLTLDGRKKINACKIHDSGAFFFSVVGILLDIKTGFDTAALGRRAISQSKSLHDSLRKFEALTIPPSEKELRHIRSDGRQFYEREVRGHPEPLQAVFVGIEDGKPAYVVVVFTVADDSDGRMVVVSHVHDCPGDCRENPGPIVLGSNVAAQAAIREP